MCVFLKILHPTVYSPSPAQGHIKREFLPDVNPRPLPALPTAERGIPKSSQGGLLAYIYYFFSVF